MAGTYRNHTHTKGTASILRGNADMLSLILISFAANAALAYVVYQLRKRLVETEQRQQQAEKEIEEMFSGYLLEMEEQNRKLADALAPFPGSGGSGAHRENTARMNDETTHAVSSSANDTIQKQPVIDRPVNEQNQDLFPVPPIGAEAPDEVFSSVDSQVLYLREQGFSAAEIAKKLNKGKTEIELILKFH